MTKLEFVLAICLILFATAIVTYGEYLIEGKTDEEQQ